LILISLIASVYACHTRTDYDALRIASIRYERGSGLHWLLGSPYHFTVVPKSKRPYKDTDAWPFEWLRRSIESEWVMRLEAAATKINPLTSSRKRTSCVHACCHARVHSWDENNRLHVRILCTRSTNLLLISLHVGSECVIIHAYA